MRKEIWELGGSVMEGGEKQEERKNTNEEIRGRNGTCRLRGVGGGVLTYGRSLITSLPPKYLVINYHFTLKVPPIFHLPP